MKCIALNQFYYYNDLINDSSMLKIAHPDWISTRFIGNTISNRSIMMIRMGKGDKGIIMTGGVHGRESINPVVLMAMVEYYALCCEDEEEAKKLKEKTGVDAKAFFEEYSLYVVPLLNPDGYMVALQGYDVIHNEEIRNRALSKGIPYEQWKYNVRGIDINRNFPSRDFRVKFTGDEPASELETKALMHLFDDVDSVCYLDFHSRGEEIYYHRRQMSDQYNLNALSLARRIKEATGYQLVKPEEEITTGDSGGNTVHYYSELYEKPAITIETVPEEATFPLGLNYQKAIYCQIVYVPFCICV